MYCHSANCLSSQKATLSLSNCQITNAILSLNLTQIVSLVGSCETLTKDLSSRQAKLFSSTEVGRGVVLIVVLILVLILAPDLLLVLLFLLLLQLQLQLPAGGVPGAGDAAAGDPGGGAGLHLLQAQGGEAGGRGSGPQEVALERLVASLVEEKAGSMTSLDEMNGGPVGLSCVPHPTTVVVSGRGPGKLHPERLV
jgi:hypothetical protein